MDIVPFRARYFQSAWMSHAFEYERTEVLFG
jgi:hypothetical protein